MSTAPDTAWNDDEIVFSNLTPDTEFVFDRMTIETIKAVSPAPGEDILDVACGRAKDALDLARSGARLMGIEASDTMLQRAVEYMGAANRGKVKLARSLAEHLPFVDRAFDKVVCKGAMDHFVDLKAAMAEMARITKPDGHVIIAIANFESLTCRLGRALWPLRARLTGHPLEPHPFWEPPADHNHKFDLKVLTDLMNSSCRLEKVVGVSLLWGFPKWGALLQKLPPSLASAILKALDALARLFPSLSDVLIATGKPK